MVDASFDGFPASEASARGPVSFAQPSRATPVLAPGPAALRTFVSPQLQTLTVVRSASVSEEGQVQFEVQPGNRFATWAFVGTLGDSAGRLVLRGTHRLQGDQTFTGRFSAMRQ